MPVRRRLESNLEAEGIFYLPPETTWVKEIVLRSQGSSKGIWTLGVKICHLSPAHTGDLRPASTTMVINMQNTRAP